MRVSMEQLNRLTSQLSKHDRSLSIALNMHTRRLHVGQEEQAHPPVHAARPGSAGIPACASPGLLRLQRLMLVAGARLGLQAGQP